MAGLFDALNAGRTSLSVHQKSIEIVGNNVANVNTEGYSRQRAELIQIPAVNFGDFFIGQGVSVADVSRDYSSFINRQLQESHIAYGEESGKTNALTELERLFNTSEDNLASAIDDFFDAWQELTTNPSGQVERDIVMQRGGLLSDAFAQMTDEMDSIVENLNTEIIGAVETVNEQLEEVAELNARIQIIEVNGQTANSARDQRDLLVQELSQTLGVQTYTDSNGRLTVHLPGGLPLVQGDTAMRMSTVTSGSNVSLQLDVVGVTRAIDSSEIGGRFKGMFEVRDNFIGGLQDDLDTLAIDLTSAVNDLHINGYYRDPTTGTPATGQLFFTDITALPPDVHASRSISLAFTDSRYIAAAGKDTAAPGDNENALLISSLETDHTVTGTNDSFDAYFSQMVAEVGIEAGRNDLALSGAEDATVQLQNLRDGFSGVSLEEEMIDLIKYQRGFESSAKFLSTVDEMMNALLQLKV
ncbi:MAG: flagellar hook-associated protein FlgK [Desulfobulbus propionicus]|nr:MAG: flagellar hook-associated protein FlgK [Desulfobulbus propionicus]